MRRRKWWFIGIGVILLVAYILVWKCREPPYRFMHGMSLWMVYMSDSYQGPRSVPAGPVEASAIYVSDEAPEQVCEAAAQDLGPRAVILGGGGDLLVGASHWIQIRNVPDTTYANRYGHFPPLPKGTKTVVTVSGPPTISHRVQAWLYGLRWKVYDP